MTAQPSRKPTLSLVLAATLGRADLLERLLSCFQQRKSSASRGFSRLGVGVGEKGAHLQWMRRFGNCEEQGAEISQQASEPMEESLFHCTEQTGILSSIISSASPVFFCKTELLLELQEVSKDRALLRSSSSASLGLDSNLVWFNYADFALIFFPPNPD